MIENKLLFSNITIKSTLISYTQVCKTSSWLLNVVMHVIQVLFQVFHRYVLQAKIELFMSKNRFFREMSN